MESQISIKCNFREKCGAGTMILALIYYQTFVQYLISLPVHTKY